MDINKILDNVIKIDKKIFRVYEEMTINDYEGKSNEQKIYELKELISLENWAYKNLNLSYENIKLILDKLEKLSIGDCEKEISQIILCEKIKTNSMQLIHYRVDDKYVEQLVLCRVYDHLSKLYYLDDRTPKDVNCYIEGGQPVAKKDDETDIYITDDSYFKMRLLSEKEYIKKAISEHRVVLAFNKRCKKKLEIEAQTDIEQMLIMLLDIKSDIDVNNKYFYFDEIYRTMFNNKTLEYRVIGADFVFDDLFEQFSIQHNSVQANKDFLKVHREQLSYLVIFEFIHYLFSFTDSKFIGDDYKAKNNIILFNIYIEKLKAYISVIRYDELNAIKIACYKHYQEIIDNNKCAEMVYSCFDQNRYQMLYDFVNMGVEDNKVKSYQN